MSKEKDQGPKMVNVKALKMNDKKKQHMAEGHVYEVTEELSKILIKNKSAVLTTEPVGKSEKAEKASDKEELTK
jgi:hypothetical protein